MSEQQAAPLAAQLAAVAHGINQAGKAFGDAFAKATAALAEDTEPTWRDVKLAAHRAGYRVEKHLAGGGRWLITSADDSHPWYALVTHSDERGWAISLHGAPMTIHIDPAEWVGPARVLEAARLAGLTGDTDA